MPLIIKKMWLTKNDVKVNDYDSENNDDVAMKNDNVKENDDTEKNDNYI